MRKLTLLAILVLAGCGGGGSEPTSADYREGYDVGKSYAAGGYEPDSPICERTAEAGELAAGAPLPGQEDWLEGCKDGLRGD